MHEKNIAIIEIELAPHPNQPVHVIRRTIDRSKGSTGKRSRGIAASVYQINEKVVKLDDVKKLVSEVYHIQIENLCTFLPQDRVGSFSGFNSKQLLLETEKSVSGTKHLYEDHQRLIELEADLLSSESNLETVKVEVDQLEQDVKRLEEAKKLMEEREESMKMQDLYRQKMLWVEFEELRTLAVQKKNEKTEIKKLLKKATAGLQPLQQEIQELEREYAGGKQRRVALNRKTESCMKIYHRCLQKIEKHQDQIDELQSELEAIESTQRRAEKEVEIRRRAVEDAKAVLKDYPSEEEIKKHVDDALVNVRIAKRKIVQNRQTFSQFKA
jgi:chromosome segregation ATPase